jgi:hypothetical protein
MSTKFVLYPGTTHGFAARGDPNDPKVAQAKEDAAQEAVAFFNKIHS